VHVLVCLADNPNARLRDVAARVGITDLMSRKVREEQLRAREAVYAVLRRDYPCKTDDDD